MYIYTCKFLCLKKIYMVIVARLKNTNMKKKNHLKIHLKVYLFLTSFTFFHTYNVFLFSSSGNMTGTTVQINPSSTAFRITGINGSTALGHQMMVSIIDYTK